jgi:hypothetical protein
MHTHAQTSFTEGKVSHKIDPDLHPVIARGRRSNAVSTCFCRSDWSDRSSR